VLLLNECFIIVVVVVVVVVVVIIIIIIVVVVVVVDFVINSVRKLLDTPSYKFTVVFNNCKIFYSHIVLCAFY
jgi:hypothetical protein